MPTERKKLPKENVALAEASDKEGLNEATAKANEDVSREYRPRKTPAVAKKKTGKDSIEIKLPKSS